MSDSTTTLTAGTFDEVVNASEKPVLVDFWAEWCQPCRMLAPTIEQVATKYDGKVKVGKLDVDGNRETALKYSIQSIPTVVLIKDGEVVNKFVGLQGEDVFSNAIDAALA